MKIIVSHDVDHLYPRDHVFRDLIFPKLWVRGFLELLRGEIGMGVFAHRVLSLFDERLNRIPEIIEYDKAHGVPSTFFFGMANVLGMSYTTRDAKTWIGFVRDAGFDAGVHGVDFEKSQNIRDERNRFQEASRLQTFGIRTHYVRGIMTRHSGNSLTPVIYLIALSLTSGQYC